MSLKLLVATFVAVATATYSHPGCVNDKGEEVDWFVAQKLVSGSSGTTIGLAPWI